MGRKEDRRESKGEGEFNVSQRAANEEEKQEEGESEARRKQRVEEERVEKEATWEAIHAPRPNREVSTNYISLHPSTLPPFLPPFHPPFHPSFFILSLHYPSCLR